MFFLFFRWVDYVFSTIVMICGDLLICASWIASWWPSCGLSGWCCTVCSVSLPSICLQLDVHRAVIRQWEWIIKVLWLCILDVLCTVLHLLVLKHSLSNLAPCAYFLIFLMHSLLCLYQWIIRVQALIVFVFGWWHVYLTLPFNVFDEFKSFGAEFCWFMDGVQVDLQVVDFGGCNSAAISMDLRCWLGKIRLLAGWRRIWMNGRRCDHLVFELKSLLCLRFICLVLWSISFSW